VEYSRDDERGRLRLEQGGHAAEEVGDCVGGHHEMVSLDAEEDHVQRGVLDDRERRVHSRRDVAQPAQAVLRRQRLLEELADLRLLRTLENRRQAEDQRVLVPPLELAHVAPVERRAPEFPDSHENSLAREPKERAKEHMRGHVRQPIVRIFFVVPVGIEHRRQVDQPLAEPIRRGTRKIARRRRRIWPLDVLRLLKVVRKIQKLDQPLMAPIAASNAFLLAENVDPELHRGDRELAGIAQNNGDRCIADAVESKAREAVEPARERREQAHEPAKRHRRHAALDLDERHNALDELRLPRAVFEEAARYVRERRQRLDERNLEVGR